MQLTDEQLQNILENTLPDVISGLKTELKDLVIEQIKYRTSEVIGPFVTEWLQTNVIPEVEKNLVESKAGLAGLAAKIAEDSVLMLVDAHSVSLKKKLESSYERSAIFKALFGS